MAGATSGFAIALGLRPLVGVGGISAITGTTATGVGTATVSFFLTLTLGVSAGKLPKRAST